MKRFETRHECAAANGPLPSGRRPVQGTDASADADACPTSSKTCSIGGQPVAIALTLVANQPLRGPSCRIFTCSRSRGTRCGDHTIVQHVRAGDLVVTADIPLAAQVVAKGAHALNPRGQAYTPENIHEHLTMRHVMDELRQSGVETGGPSPFRPRDRQAFANQLDRLLTQAGNTGSDAIG